VCVYVWQRDEKKKDICTVSDKCQTGDNQEDGNLGSWKLKKTILTVRQKGETGMTAVFCWPGAGAWTDRQEGPHILRALPTSRKANAIQTCLFDY
jgi:hypothetical protein